MVWSCFDSHQLLTLECLLYLARRYGAAPVSAGEVANAIGASRYAIAKILQRLALGGIAISQRGHAGGFVLARSPAEISIAEALQAISGSAPVEEPLCHQHSEGISRLQAEWEEHLNQRTLADLIRISH